MSTPVFSQKGKWGFGFGGVGTDLTAAESASTSMGYGGEGVFSYLFNESLSLNWIIGYNLVDHVAVTGAPTLQTNIISSTLMLEYEIPLLKSFRPFISLGGGGHNFQVDQGDRFSDGEGAVGGGARIYFGSRTALYVSGLYKLSLGDALDGIDQGDRDGYINISAGLQFFRGGKKKRELVDPALTQTPFDDMPPVDSAPDTTMQEQEAMAEVNEELRDQRGELEERLNAASSEIQQLKNEIAQKDSQITILAQTQLDKPDVAQINRNDVRTIYSEALDSFYNRNYAEALDALQQLSDAVPNHSLRSNFIYWRGECFYAQGKYMQAIAEFEKVLAFPNSPKEDDALLMLGRSHIQVGDKSSAKHNLQRLVQDFPKSEYKAKAEKYLQPILDAE